MCGHVSWPAPHYCEEGCGQTISPAEIPNDATVYVSTVISVAHPIYGETYQVGYADMSMGPRVFGHFSTPEPVAIGTPVQVQLVDFNVPGEPNRKASTAVFQVGK